MLRPAAVALLVVCAVCVAGASATDAARPSPGGDAPRASANDVAVLPLESSARSNMATQSIDVATAVATQEEAARSRLDRYALEAAFERAADEQTRRELLFEAATDVEIEISALRSTQRELRAGYVDGSISSATFLRRVSVIQARAGQLGERLTTIQAFADRVPRLSMQSRLQSLEASLIGFDGPVTSRIATSISGEQPPIRLYVSASPNGSALSMIGGDEYVRVAFRSDNWVPDSTTGLNLDRVELRAGELYPVAFNSSQTRSRGIGIVDAGIYRINIGYDQGTILAYLDGDTEGVFYEVQRQPLTAIQTGPVTQTTDNGTRVLVNRTFSGGPLRIAVVDAGTGTPQEATVLISGVEQSDDVKLSTGPDGVVWTTMPAEEARVTAVTATGEATLVVSADRSDAMDELPSVRDEPPPPTTEA